MNTAIDNQQVSFAELPPKEQVKLLMAHNRNLERQIRKLNERFIKYEESDAELLEENTALKKQLSEVKAQIALQRSKPAVKPNQVSSPQIAKFKKRYRKA